MKILDFINWRPKKLKDALFPVSVVNWISGLHTVEIPIGHPRPVLSLIYLAIMIIVYHYLTQLNGIFSDEIHSCETSHNKGHTIVDILPFYNGIIAFICVIINWNSQKVLQLCIQRIELLQISQSHFGLENHHDKIFVRLVLTLIVALSGMSFAIVMDIVLLHKENDLKHSIYCSYFIDSPIVLNLIIDLSFGTMVTTIGYSFQNINVLLENSANKNLILKKLYVNRTQLKKKILILPAQFNFNTTEKSRDMIQLIKHQHLELSKIAWEVEKVYGPQIAMSMVSVITVVISNSYDLYNLIFINNSEENSDKKILLIIKLMWWCILHTLRVLYVNGVCAKVAAEAQKAEELIFCVNRTNQDAELRKEIEQFSLQLAQLPLNFTMYGLTSLNYSFVSKFLGTIITYLIIAVQINPKRKHAESNNTLTTPIA